LNAISEIDKGLGIVDLGSDLYKVRIAKNKGKSGGYRTIIIFRKGFRSLFIHGFEKSKVDNISDRELSIFKKNAKDFLEYSELEVKRMLELGEILKLEKIL